MAYDSARGVTVLFGGDTIASVEGDTWEWDGTAWIQRFPTLAPPARLGHTMAYDSARGVVVLFGGTNWPVDYNDTWEWDGATWTQRFPQTNPPASVWHSMAYMVAGDRTVLFRGNRTSGQSETWQWDGANWQLVANASLPQPRIAAQMTYDTQAQHAVLFGGGWASMQDTWTWDGTAWAQSSPSTAPSSRGYAGFTYDARRDRCVMFGGVAAPTATATDELWEWDGATWSLASATTSPAPRLHGSLAYDSHRGLTVLFGGWAPGMTVAFGDTWELFVPTNTASAQAYGTACGAPAVGLASHAGSRPLLGQSHVGDITNAPFGFAGVVWGVTSQAIALDFLGINNCTLWNGGEGEIGSFCQSTSFNTAQHTFSIPFDATLDGVHVYMQAWVLAPNYNPFGIATSNGLDLLIGGV